MIPDRIQTSINDAQTINVLRDIANSLRILTQKLSVISDTLVRMEQKRK